jgi:hypothetical protein
MSSSSRRCRAWWLAMGVGKKRRAWLWKTRATTESRRCTSTALLALALRECDAAVVPGLRLLVSAADRAVRALCCRALDDCDERFEAAGKLPPYRPLLFCSSCGAIEVRTSMPGSAGFASIHVLLHERPASGRCLASRGCAPGFVFDPNLGASQEQGRGRGQAGQSCHRQLLA